MLRMLCLIVLYQLIYHTLYLFSYVLDLLIYYCTLIGRHILQLM